MAKNLSYVPMDMSAIRDLQKITTFPWWVLRADLKQHVKQGIYHIQNVNSMHNRVKKWIDSTFWGVSTKYLQNYLNWYRIQEAYKKSICVKQDMANGSTEDIFSLNRYRLINDRYQVLIATQI